MLDIVVSYHCIFVYIAISRKTTEPNLREWEKTSFGPDFGPFGASKIFFSKIWLRQSLDIMFSYHHVQHQKKLTIQS